MHEFIQNSATRFILCNFTRISNTTRQDRRAEHVSNGSSWNNGSTAVHGLICECTLGSVYQCNYNQQNTDFGVTISKFLALFTASLRIWWCGHGVGPVPFPLFVTVGLLSAEYVIPCTEELGALLL
eukprot:COSAG02_NODE_2945_length_7687_cov_25.192541_1_plen_126_part_00